jgi:hypothetical protein
LEEQARVHKAGDVRQQAHPFVVFHDRRNIYVSKRTAVNFFTVRGLQMRLSSS